MTTTTPERNAAEARFIAALGELERGPLAELRRSLSYRSGQSFFLERLIYDHLPEWYRGGWNNRAAYLVAGLYALVERPHNDPPPDEPEAEEPETTSIRAPRNLGSALGRLYRVQDERPSTEKRFLALLDADEEQLPDHLRHAVTLLNAGDIRPDWAQLLADAASWNSPERRDRTRERWAQAFYRPDPKAISTDGTPTDSTPAQEATP